MHNDDAIQTSSEERYSEERTAAIRDLSDWLGVSSDSIHLISDESVTWRDGSVGCPDSRMIYTQALVPGRRIILEVDGLHYAYHASRNRPLFYCDNPQDPLPAGAGGWDGT